MVTKKSAMKIITNWKVILLVFCLILALVAINPAPSTNGVAITAIEKNSSAEFSGMQNPKTSVPRAREVITSVNGKGVSTPEEYFSIIQDLDSLGANYPLEIRTNKNPNGYIIYTEEEFNVTVTNETEIFYENSTKEVFDNETNTTVNVTEEVEIIRNKTIETPIGIKELGIDVGPVSSTNIRQGLDLAGGTRVILQPEEQLSPEDFSLLIQNMKQRLNVYGLSDIVVRPTTDLVGDQFIVVEIAGVNQEEVKELIAEQGNFEAKIGNVTVFSGGDDIRSVIRSADRSGIDPSRGCGLVAEGSWICSYFFGIVLSSEAAERQAAETQTLLSVSTDENGNVLPRNQQYLEKQLDFYLDGVLTDSLNIGADLRGRAVTEIQISGTGTGVSEQEARTSALQDMKRMQTLLITGSLPVKLNIVKTDTISPVLGKEFLNNALLIGLIALLAVIIIVTAVYRNIQVVIPLIITVISEMVLILGFAAAAGWNLDLASIAGIIIVIGTGIDHLIIITDETLQKSSEQLSWVQKIKRAFSIVIIAGLTTVGAMLPLLFAGAGLLKGFALTTMVGVIIGVLIVRPAYSAVIEILLSQKE